MNHNSISYPHTHTSFSNLLFSDMRGMNECSGTRFVGGESKRYVETVVAACAAAKSTFVALCRLEQTRAQDP